LLGCGGNSGGVARHAAPDRIALAAELLPAGYVVARDVGERDALEYVPGANSAESYACGYVAGHNACRAAMMREGE
jgi:hypothetical protein